MRKRTQGIIILFLLFVSEIGLSYLVVYDLAWIYGIIAPNQISILTIVGIVVSFTLTVMLLSIRITKKKQILYGFKEFSDKKTIFLAIFFISIVLFGLSSNTTIDLNDAYQVEHNNAESLWFYNSTTYDYIVHMYSSINVTSDETNSVMFWYNTSILTNVTSVMFVYYNGTHSMEGNYNKTFPITETPDTRWWTGYTWWFSNDFGNGTERSSQYYRGFNIPAQKANTTVIYRLAFRMENATGFYYTTYFEYNYTVLFSSSENTFNENLTQTTQFYSALLGFALVADVGLTRLFYPEDVDNHEKKQKAESIGILDKRVDDETYPSVREMILISEKLESKTNQMRVMSGVLMALAITTFSYLRTDRTLRSFFDITMVLLLLTVVWCLLCLVLSLGGIEVQDGTNILSESMIPTTDTLEEFRFLIYLRITKQEERIDSMKQLLQIGIIGIIIGVVIDFLLAIMMPGYILGNYWFTTILLFSAIGLLLIGGALFVLLMVKSIGYLPRWLELRENPD